MLFGTGALSAMLLLLAVMFFIYLLRMYQLRELQNIKTEISLKEKIVQKYKTVEGNLRAIQAKLQVLDKTRGQKEQSSDIWVKLQASLPQGLEILSFSAEAERGALFEISAGSFSEAAAFLNDFSRKQEALQLSLRSVNFNPETNQVFLKVQLGK